MKGRVTVPFFIPHHGCPHRCIFCDQLKISGAASAVPSSDLIRDTIDSYRASSGQPRVDVAFFGGTFTSLPVSVQKSLLAPVQDLQGVGVVGSVRISTRPDAVDETICRFLGKHGVNIVELGAQSLDDDVLQRAGRGHCAADVARATRVLLDNGFQVGLQLMAGLPGDTAEKFLASLRDALGLQPHFLRVYPVLVLAGTRLAELYRRGEYEPLSMDEAVDVCAAALRLVHASRVAVIRMGLQPTEELNAAGCVLAGPYHPAFGQLVRSRLWYDLMAALAEPGVPATIRCSPGRISDLVGQRRSNIHRLFNERRITAKVEGDSLLGPLELVVETSRGTRSGNIMTGAYGLPEVA